MLDFASSFPPKFKLLREVHNLSTLQIADFFAFKSNGSVTQLEQGTTKPTLAAMDDIVSMFGVSVDWLFGLSDIIYRADILLGLEQKLYDFDFQNQSYSWMISYPIYNDINQRQAAFSLPIRANIIFCCHILRKSAEIRANEIIPFSSDDVVMPDSLYDSKLQAYKDNLRNMLYPVMLKLEGKRKANIRWNLCSMCYDLLQDYIVVADDDPRKRTTPVFDVEAAWKEKEGRKQN